MTKGAGNPVLEVRESLEDIIEKLPNGIVVLDEKGVVLFCNPAVEEIFGMAAGKMLGSALGLPVKTGGRLEIDTISKDGVGGVAEMHVEEICWEGRTAYLVSFFDITEIKKAAAALKAANEKLVELDRMKSEFVSIASHELRTPLTAIKNAVDIILKRKAGAVTETQEKFLSMAARNIARLRAIINDILDASKIEAGKMELNLSKVDLMRPITSVLESYATLADEKRISLYVDVARDLPEIHGDEMRVEQVITNLVSNAIKFTPDKGVVTIEARLAGRPPGTEKGGRFVEVSVIDTGTGIAKEHIEHIFEKFYQADSTLDRKEQHESTGLGLAICKGLIEAHGGEIRCECKEDEGARFAFTLPLFDEKRP